MGWVEFVRLPRLFPDVDSLKLSALELSRGKDLPGDKLGPLKTNLRVL
jgi:hypothetical protein